MSQQDVYEFLRKHKTSWFSARDIKEQLDVSIGSITNSLKKLRESKQILYRIVQRKSKTSNKRQIYEYKFKR